MVIDYSAGNGVGVITFNRPPANAYDSAMLAQLREAVLKVAEDPAVRVAVVRSDNPKFFCAGADISTLKDAPRARFAHFLTLAQEAADAICRTPKLFIAAINGHCIGGGLEIALSCDFRWAAAGQYRLGLAEVNLGLSPGMGGTQRLPRLIPRSKALQMMVTGDPVGPDEALALGLVDKVVQAESLDAEVLAFAQKLAGGATLAQGLIKLSVNNGLETSLAQGLVIERAYQGQLFASDDAAEGVRAFLEKRPAKFTGK